MKWIFVDFGTHKLKALRGTVDGSKLIVDDFTTFPSRADYFHGLAIPTHAAWHAIQVGLTELGWLGPGEETIISSSLPSAYLESRYLKFPFKSSKKIEKVLPFELEAVIPFDIEEILVRQIVLTGEGVSSKKKETPVLTFAYKRSLIAEIEAEFKKFQPSTPPMTPQILALSTLYRAIEGKNFYLILELGHSKSHLLMMHKSGRILGVRTLWWGGKTLVDILQETIRADETEASKIIRKLGTLKSLPKQLYPSILTFAGDIKQTLKSWRAEGIEIPEEMSIYTMGRLSHITNVFSTLNEGLKGEYKLKLEPFPTSALSSRSVVGLEGLQDIEEAVPAVATALMQLRAYRRNVPTFSETSFQMQQSLKKIKSGSFSILKRVAMLLIAPALYMGVYMYYQGKENETVLESLRTTLKKTGLKISSDLPPDKIVMQMKLEVASNKRKIDQISEDDNSPLVILTRFSKEIPTSQKIDITEFRVTSKTIFISAQTDDEVTARQIIGTIKSKFGEAKEGAIQDCKDKKDCKSFSIEITRET